MTLSIDDAKALVIEFCATYPVASTIAYKIRDTQEELYGPHATREAEGTILGSFRPGRGRADFAVSNFRDEGHFRRTLRHEVLGHFGINTFNPEEKRAVLDRLVESRNEPGLAGYWREIDELYSGISELGKAEEVFAFVCEDIEPQTRVDADAGAQSFQETCIERSRPMAFDDLVNITSMVAEGLHDRSRSQQNFPATDDAQFKLENTPNTSESPVWLAVPHDAREAVRLAAGKLENGQSAIGWDKEASLWFARPGADLDRIAQWLPDTSIRSGGGDPEAEFLDALTREGLVLQGMPIMDGERHRVATVEDKKGNKSGVYRGFLDRRPGGWFINYHRAETEKSVTNWSATGGDADPVARLHIRAAARQSQEDAARAREQLYAQQTLSAKSLYDRLPGADPAHPYLVRKGIPPTPELRQTRNGALVVPFFNASGTFKTLQYIPPEGEKYLFKDAPKQGHFLVVGGSLTAGKPVLYAEGYATARSLNLASGLPVVMTIDAGNMVAVAKVLHERFPDSPHVFLADFDHAKAVNKGLQMATTAAEQVGGQVLYPAFTDEEKARGLTDFNDLHQSQGLDAVRSQISAVLAHTNEVPTMQEDDLSLNRDVDLSMAEPVLPPEAPVPLNFTYQGEPVSLGLQPIDPEPVAPTQLASADDEALRLQQRAEEQMVMALDPAPPLPENATQFPSVPQVDVQDEAPPVANEPPIVIPSDDENERVVEADVPLTPPRQGAAVGDQPAVESPVDAIVVGSPRPSGTEEEPQVANIDKDALLARLAWEKQSDNSVLYKLDGEPAFVDRGNRLEMAKGTSESDEKIVAALLTAAQYYRGRIELTGSEAFQSKAIGLIALHQLNVEMKNPAQRALLDDARKALTAEPTVRDAIAGEAAPLWGSEVQPQASTSPGPQPPQDAQPSPLASPAVSNDALPLPQSTVTPGPVLLETQVTTAHPGTHQASKPDPATRSENPALHQNSEAAKQGVSGKVMDFGQAPFKFEKDNTESTFIKLRTRTGMQTYWGKELAGLLRDTRVERGRMVTLQWLGKEAVTVKVPRRDDQGAIVRFDEVNTHRNQWSLTVLGSPAVRTGQDEGVKLAPYDALRFAAVQQVVIKRLGLDLPVPAAPGGGLYWMTPDGHGSAKAGDELSAQRPGIDPKHTAGQPVITSWSQDGHLDMLLVRGDGDYLQGVVRQGGQFQHVLVSLPNSPDAPRMVFNAITPEGIAPIGTGNGINRSGGEPVSRENIAFKLEGDSAVRIGKLDSPGDISPALHARLGFDERWKAENNLPKSAPTAAPSVQPNNPRPA